MPVLALREEAHPHLLDRVEPRRQRRLLADLLDAPPARRALGPTQGPDVAPVGQVGHRERHPAGLRAHPGEGRVRQRGEVGLEAGHLPDRRVDPVARHDEVGRDLTPAVGALDLDTHDTAVLALHEADDAVLVHHVEIARERVEYLADLDRHGDRRPVLARRDVPALAPDLVEHADLLQRVVPLEAEHVAPRDVGVLGHALDHGGLDAPQLQQLREREADHSPAGDDDLHRSPPVHVGAFCSASILAPEGGGV